MTSAPASESLLRELAGVVGAGAVTTDPDELRRFGSDLYYDGVPPLAMARPADTAELRALVGLVTSRGHAVVPRGGGVSYTGGYSARVEGAVLVDTGGMDRVLRVAPEDGYVTVEAGCTWKRLSDALEGTGTRAAFHGPFSGAFATVGGAVSQSAVVWGAARHGTSAESVLSLSVVLADGSLLRTGHDATSNAGGEPSAPHYRPYGPDLTGLFLGDCGALGVKATVTLRLVEEPAATECLTFTFDRDAALVEAMVELAGRGLGTTVVATDAVMARQRIRRFEVEQGRLPDTEAGDHTLHVVVDGVTGAAARSEAGEARALCTRHGGLDVGPGPTQRLLEVRFITMTSSVGPAGEGWAPMHMIVPRSDAGRAWRRLRDLEARHADLLSTHSVTVGYLLTTVSTQAVIIEPALYWPGPRRPIHDLVLTPSERAAFPDHALDPATADAVEHYRREMAEVFDELGAAHLQIGRTYPYAQRRDPVTLSLLRAVKAHLDPDGLVNPGVLGL